MIYGKANLERRVYGEDLLIEDLPDVTEQEFWFRTNDLQTVAHLLWPKQSTLIWLPELMTRFACAIETT
jgi:hypothetical protein